MKTAADVIAALALEPLPLEGGYFRRTWTSDDTLPGGRPVGTAIYFLMTPEVFGFSALHRLTTDELWLFHAGDPVEHVQLSTSAEGAAEVTLLGGDLAIAQTPQLRVAAGRWQGARIAPGGPHGWSLFTCTMSPGWEDGGFELGERASLTREFPDAAEWITRLTR